MVYSGHLTLLFFLTYILQIWWVPAILTKVNSLLRSISVVYKNIFEWLRNTWDKKQPGKKVICDRRRLSIICCITYWLSIFLSPVFFKIALQSQCYFIGISILKWFCRRNFRDYVYSEPFAFSGTTRCILCCSFVRHGSLPETLSPGDNWLSSGDFLLPG